ncbi:MAG: hypothetical protein K9J85_06105 [Desulfobacteraceae bacterium]|nr:hypothetical protein [Desulfobacteraceae bacterium]
MFLFRLVVKTLAASALVLVFLANAGAYIPPAPFIIDLMVKNRQIPEQLRATQDITIYPDPEKEPGKLEQKVYFRLPDSFRSEISTDNLVRIHVSNRGSSATVLDGELLEGREPWHTCYKDLFLLNSRRAVIKYLGRQGVETNVSSLGRLDRNLVYVIGARYPDEGEKQLWIDKESFYPVRWIVTPAQKAGGPPVHEIRYLDWERAQNTLYPGKIEFYENGEKFQVMVIDNIEVNPSLPGDLFDAGALRRSASKTSGGRQEQEEAGGAGGDIRRQLEEFKNIYESGSR